MVKHLVIENINCDCLSVSESHKVVYLIYPEIEPFKEEWLRNFATKYCVNLIVIYIPASGWNDMLTPWPEPGETKDSEPFGGKAEETFSLLKEKIIPQTEQSLGLTSNLKRDLIGVSLSGLFTLWQWLQYDLFDSIGCLSGSFWYEGFVNWFEKYPVHYKPGKAYFLLGTKEPKAWIKAYRSVGENTEIVIERLKSVGISTEFEWVPGDHFADPLERMEKAVAFLA